MSKNIVIAGVTVKRDDNGLYCLNDLWRARGANRAEQVSNWSKTTQAKQLIELVSLNPSIVGFKQTAGRYGGTYANKKLVYDYAMWISPEFKSHVIDVFDSAVVGNITSSLTSSIEGIKLGMIDISKAIDAASVHFDDVTDCGKAWGKAGSDIRKAKKSATEQLTLLRDEIQMKLEFVK
jgi:hypothetical protein